MQVFETPSCLFFGIIKEKEILKIQKQAYQAGENTVRCSYDKNYSIRIMHYKNYCKKTDFNSYRGREISVHSNSSTTSTHCSARNDQQICMNIIIMLLFAVLVRLWGRESETVCLTPWNLPSPNSERATETIREQEQPGFCLSLHYFCPCSHPVPITTAADYSSVKQQSLGQHRGCSLVFFGGHHGFLDRSITCCTSEIVQEDQRLT